MVTGGRNWKPTSSDAAQQFVSLLLEHNVTHLHYGGCRGFDQWAASIAFTQGIPIIEHPANWKRYGAPAGPIRNREMAQTVQDSGGRICIAAPGGTGTRDATLTAENAGLLVIPFGILP
jgi:hypothetical protein